MSKLAVLSVPIDSVKPDPNNARRHPERNLAAIAASLARFGQQRPILVDKDGVIVAGNGLWTAMKAAGAESVLIARTELTGAERVAYAIADNRTAELSEWDAEVLAAQLSVIGDDGIIGFTEQELELALGSFSVTPAQDKTLTIEQPEFSQITFTLSSQQHADVTAAVRKATEVDAYTSTENTNKNGNAIAAICRHYLDAT